jgi:hypothetical protein
MVYLAMLRLRLARLGDAEIIFQTGSQYQDYQTRLSAHCLHQPLPGSPAPRQASVGCELESGLQHEDRGGV